MTNETSASAAALLLRRSCHCHLSGTTNWVEVSHPRAAMYFLEAMVGRGVITIYVTGITHV